MTAATPVDGALFASLDPPLLAGSRCELCSTVVFPVARSCPRCSSPALQTVPLPDRGTLWSWTVQGYPPKLPYVAPTGTFEPYALGYVDLGEVIVEGLLDIPRELLDIGLPVRLTLRRAWGTDGAETVTYGFSPDLPTSAVETP